MNNTIRQALTSLGMASALLASGSAMADNFEFSYSFNTGEQVTGSFVGTLADDLVSDISQLAVSIDGVAFAGPLQAFRYTQPGGNCGTCFEASGAVVSFDPMENNFFFSNGNAATSFEVTNYFYVIPWPNPPRNNVPQNVATQGLINGTTINVFNGQYEPQNWMLTAAPVPEPASVSMLLVGLAAVVSLGQRRRAQRAEALAPQA
jgi:PEP-CTERM motif